MRTANENFAINGLADALVKLCPVEVVAQIIDCTLSAECDDRLNAYQSRMAEKLFDCLCTRSPEAVDMAQQGLNFRYAEPNIVLEPVKPAASDGSHWYLVDGDGQPIDE